MEGRHGMSLPWCPKRYFTQTGSLYPFNTKQLMKQTQTLNAALSAKSWNQIILFSRASLFIVFFWFGVLKLLNWSPAEGLVQHLHQVTISSFISLQSFMYVLGGVECLIGILFLVPAFTRIAFTLFLTQMATTFLPLFLLPSDSWQNAFALTLTGQYIVKNVSLVALAWVIYYDYKHTVKEVEVSSEDSKISLPKMAYAWNTLLRFHK